MTASLPAQGEILRSRDTGGNGQNVRLQSLVDLVQVWPLASRVKHTERVGLLKALVLLGHKAGR